MTASALRLLAVELFAHLQIKLTVQRQQPTDDRQHQQISGVEYAEDQEDAPDLGQLDLKLYSANGVCPVVRLLEHRREQDVGPKIR